MWSLAVSLCCVGLCKEKLFVQNFSNFQARISIFCHFQPLKCGDYAVFPLLCRTVNRNVGCLGAPNASGLLLADAVANVSPFASKEKLAIFPACQL